MKTEPVDNLEGVEFEPDETPPEFRWGHDEIEVIEVKSEPDIKTEPVDEEEQIIHFESFMNSPEEEFEQEDEAQINWE